MAPKKKPGKDAEEKKSKGKKAAEETDGPEPKEESVVLPITEITNSTSEISKPEPTPVQEEVAETKYEEPVLTSIIVEKYEGGKDKGLFQGFGKALYRGGHTYEGEFNLGMMNGKGKYIWANGISYEGDFRHNEIIGTGIYRWVNEDNPTNFSQCATYEGEVLNGKRHGFGTFKSGNDTVIYVGEWNMGKRYGKGKMIYDAEGHSYYEGDWINNKKFGWGIRHYPSGNSYEGMWVSDIRHGEGIMRWFDENQTYSGQWENGLQNGLGTHDWYLPRIDMTQYALRNTYYGNFKNGKRHGTGTFLYANGAKYEGNWDNNLKHGWGKYTFKDGRNYEGYFEDDKMTSSPTYNRSSLLSHEISKIKARIPSAGTTLNIHLLRANKEAHRTDFNLVLEINSILNDFDNPEKRSVESIQAHKTIIRYLDLFKQVYRFYSQLGFDPSPDNTYLLNRMQFWRFLKDCKIHLNEDCITLMEFDRLLNPNTKANELHCPYDKILIREFFNYIVLTGYHLYKEQFDGTDQDLIVSWCIEKLIVENILPHSCCVKGYFYSDLRKTLNVLTYMVKSYEIYRFLCKKRKKSPNDLSITIREFLIIFNDFKLIDGKSLTTKDIIEIFASDNPIVYDSENSYNLELEITFLEFFETLIGCALKIHENQEKNKAIPIVKPANDQISQHESNATDYISPTASAKTASHARNQSSKLEKDHQSRTTSSKNDTIKEEVEEKKHGDLKEDILNTVRTEPNEEINLNLEETKTEQEMAESDLKNWIDKNSLFFNGKFFPAVDKFLVITQLVNRSL